MPGGDVGAPGTSPSRQASGPRVAAEIIACRSSSTKASDPSGARPTKTTPRPPAVTAVVISPSTDAARSASMPTNVKRPPSGHRRATPGQRLRDAEPVELITSAARRRPRRQRAASPATGPHATTASVRFHGSTSHDGRPEITPASAGSQPLRGCTETSLGIETGGPAGSASTAATTKPPSEVTTSTPSTVAAAIHRPAVRGERLSPARRDGSERSPATTARAGSRRAALVHREQRREPREPDRVTRAALEHARVRWRRRRARRVPRGAADPASRRAAGPWRARAGDRRRRRCAGAASPEVPSRHAHARLVEPRGRRRRRRRSRRATTHRRAQKTRRVPALGRGSARSGRRPSRPAVGSSRRARRPRGSRLDQHLRRLATVEPSVALGRVVERQAVAHEGKRVEPAGGDALHHLAPPRVHRTDAGEANDRSPSPRRRRVAARRIRPRTPRHHDPACLAERRRRRPIRVDGAHGVDGDVGAAVVGRLCQRAHGAGIRRPRAPPGRGGEASRCGSRSSRKTCATPSARSDAPRTSPPAPRRTPPPRRRAVSRRATRRR